MCCSASHQMHPSSSKEEGRKMAYNFFFEPSEFGIEINRCSGMGAEECLSLSSCLLSREDLQRISIKELSLVMM